MAVTAAVHREVLARDGKCFLARLDPAHRCFDRWGKEHAHDDLDRMTADHCKERLMMGRKAPDDPAHLVALCWRGNVGVPSKVVRQAQREYLAKLYPEAWGKVASVASVVDDDA